MHGGSEKNMWEECGGVGVFTFTPGDCGRSGARGVHFSALLRGESRFLPRFPGLGSQGCKIPRELGVCSHSQLPVPLIFHLLKAVVSLCG